MTAEASGTAGRRLVLASGSPTRLRLLRFAGLDPEVVVSGVDETVPAGTDPASMVALLAERKAAAVAPLADGALVVACDSVVAHGERILGKPSSAAEVILWWQAMRGSAVTVWTGHCLVDGADGRQVSRTTSAVVRIGTPTDAELTAYAATDEPQGAAGAFRLDGRASAFLDGIDGEPGVVHGLSMPTLRAMLAELGVEVTSLWA